MSGAVGRFLSDGRLHLHHGPIDLICQAWGDTVAVTAGYQRAVARFDGVLGELVAELPALRIENAALHGPIALVMGRAVAPFRPAFITPMAAVAGAVAEAVLAAMVGNGIARAYVNNGGDIAVHLTGREVLTCAMAGTGGQVEMRAANPSRGIATSGWRGRSWSRGIADSVTVLAKTASMADAAATMIANAVDLPGHPGIARRAATDLQADSDLGHRLVTVGVSGLTAADITQALDRGAIAARSFLVRGLIDSAALFLQSDHRILGEIALKETAFA